MILAFAAMLLTAVPFPNATLPPQTRKLAPKITKDEAMLARVVLKYQSLKSVTHRVKGTMDVKTSGVSFQAGFKSESRMIRPRSFKTEAEIDFMGEVSRGVSISDGKTLWDYDPASSLYSERPLDSLAKEGKADTDWIMDRAGMDFALMLFLEQKGNKLLKVKPGAEKSVVVKNYPVKVVDGLAMHLIRVPVPPEKGEKNPGQVVLYVGAKDLLIRRCRITVPQTGADESVSVQFTCFYTQIVTDSVPPAETFTFAPPERSQKVDKLAPVFDRAFNRPGG